MLEWFGGEDCKWELTETEQRRNRVDWTDGDFVDVIHTAGLAVFGTLEAWGHADYYPNGGDLPPFLVGETCYTIDNISKDDDDTDDGDGLKCRNLFQEIVYIVINLFLLLFLSNL